jgi:hypothetical protein
VAVVCSRPLKGIGVTDNKLLGAQIKADSHNPTSPGAAC